MRRSIACFWRVACVAFGVTFLGDTGLATDAPSQDAANTRAGRLEKPELSCWIDRRFESHFRAKGQDPPLIVDDATFLRRVHLDLIGRIPTISEVRDFIDDDDSTKRMRVIDELLGDDRFPQHMARVWRRILIPTDAGSTPAISMDNWLRQNFAKNTPYDEIARELVLAGGAEARSGEAPESKNVDSIGAANAVSPVSYLTAAGGQPAGIASSVSRVFLGVRLECAQCHDHPFARWKRQDFWGVAAFFAGAKLSQPVSQAAPGAGTNGVVDSHVTTISDEDGNSYSFALPWDDENAAIEVPPDEFPRAYFARWMTSAENPHFAATAVNRIWQVLHGKPLTNSIDDLDQAAPGERDMVLDGLSKQFVEGGFDIKELVRAICASDIYQRVSETDQSATGIDARPLKVFTPEQLFDSLEVALRLPISRIDQGPRYNGQRAAVIARMEETMGNGPAEFRSGVPQALMLMNGQITADATDLKTSRALRAIIDAPFLDLDEKIDALFLTTLSRRPTQREEQKFLEYVGGKPSDELKAEALAEIMWALINSPEFVLIR